MKCVRHKCKYFNSSYGMEWYEICSAKCMEEGKCLFKEKVVNEYYINYARALQRFEKIKQNQ